LSGAYPLSLNPSATTEEIKIAAAQALTIYGRVDVLVNNAGYALSGPIEHIKCVLLLGMPKCHISLAYVFRDEDLRAQFQTNLYGPVSIIQAILPAMRAQQSGHILNVSSIAAFAGNPPFGAYNASKAALDAFTEALSVEVAPFGIRVNSIMPGYFPTNFISHALLTQDAKNVGVYTLAEQGFGGLEKMRQAHIDKKQVGDVHKAAARIWEFVSGSGLAGGVDPARGRKREWVRLPLGPDCGARMKAKIQVLQETINAYEPIWSSTDMDGEQLNQFASS